MKLNKKNSGFTLVELLVSVSIVVTCATIVVAIIASTFRSTNGASSQEKLRLAGTGALSQVSKIIRYADKFNGAYVGKNKVDCQTPDSGSSTSVNSVKVTTLAVKRTISCNSDDVLTIDGQPLWDTNSIDSGGCNIACTQQQPTDPPLVIISLTLEAPNSNLGNDSGQDNSLKMDFSQSIKMVNLNQ